MLFSEIFKAGDDDAGVGAVVNEDRRRTHPGLKVVQTQRDVLSVGSVEDPDLAVSYFNKTNIRKKRSFNDFKRYKSFDYKALHNMSPQHLKLPSEFGS